MASFTLKHEDAVVKEFAIGETATIGRMPDNRIALDSPGVSSHHACVFRSADGFVIEDLQSTNGTFVNGERITRCELAHGDVVVVGKQTLVFNQLADAATSQPQEAAATAHEGETVFLDPQKHQRLLTIIRHAEDRSAAAGEGEAFGPLGVLRVLAGTTDRPEYELKGHTSLIGSGASTLIRLRGWFKPSVAVAVTRNRQGYVATRLRGKMLVNSEPVGGRYDLKNGDVLSVGGLTLEFRLKGARSERHAGAA
jgi:pSer/pThr/pTyr-binding forkhead associated (FHA) protein